MKQKKLLSLLLSFAVICGSFAALPAKSAKAFGAGSHYTLMNQTAKALPQDSIIRQALTLYPDVAAWGANGPDLGMLQPGQALEYSPWSDRYHYDRVGSMAATQLRLALQSRDLKEIAYAAGWVTHITGDLYCHGYFVNPEAGVYAANADGRALHSELEKAAEPYVWANLGNNNIQDYKPSVFGYKFSSAYSVPFYLMNNASNSVYGSSPYVVEEQSWTNLYSTALKTGVGYNYMDYNSAMSVLNQNNRIERLTQAFQGGQNLAVKLLTDAEYSNYYGNFSNAWDTCANLDGRPMGTYSITLHTGNKIGAYTNADVYLGMELEDGTKKEWLLDKQGYNDFEMNATDDYYVYIGDQNFSPSKVKKVWLRVSGSGIMSTDNWYLQDMQIRINGDVVFTQTVNMWISATNSSWYTPVDWTSVPDAPTFQ